MTWPLCLHLKTSVIGGLGDNIYFVWLIRWYQKVFLEGQGHPFFNPMMNYPQGWNLSTTETALATALPGVPFSWLFGPIAGYNIAMLITFVLAGFFMYLWMRDLTKSKLAALLAGMIFAFSPYHIAHFITGHLNLSGIHWFPLFFWGLTKLLNPERKLDWKFVVLTGLSLGAIAFTSMYYLYMTVIFTLLFVLIYLSFSRFKPLRNKYFWFNLVLAAAISLPFLYYSLRPFVNLSTAGILSSRSLEYASMYSASPTDFFLPATDHFLLGRLFSQGFDRSLWGEGSLYIGFTALVLAVIAIIKRKQSAHKTLVLTASFIILISFILGLGINLHWNNQSVIWQIPNFLQ
ncbi:MAG: YfhO family protein, partial [Anaerolineae bacterium]|nr:YfhO family protein [Anaerolineae bacterium]